MCLADLNIDRSHVNTLVREHILNTSLGQEDCDFVEMSKTLRHNKIKYG